MAAVDPNSPAGRAGLRLGDLLQDINGSKLATTGHAYAALEEAFFKQEPLKIQIADRPTITVPAIAPPKRSLPVHPTQIFSTIDALLLCLLLLAYDPFRRRDGELSALMMSIYPVTRFLIESLRSDEAAVFGTGMSISQNVSLLLLVCAAALVVLPASPAARNCVWLPHCRAASKAATATLTARFRLRASAAIGMRRQ